MAGNSGAKQAYTGANVSWCTVASVTRSSCRELRAPYIGIRVFSAVRSHNIHSPRRNENGYRSLFLPSCISLYLNPQPPACSSLTFVIRYNPVALFFRRATSFPRPSCSSVCLVLSFSLLSVLLHLSCPHPSSNASHTSFFHFFVRHARCFAASDQSNTFPALRVRTSR